MSQYRGVQFLVLLGIYWFVYYLIIFGYVSTLSSYALTTHITTNAAYNQVTNTRFSASMGPSLYDNVWNSLGYLFGFDIAGLGIRGMNFIFLMCFSYIPLVLTLLAIWMVFGDMIMKFAEGVIGWIAKILLIFGL